MMVLRIFYYLLVLTCIGISTYLTYYGFLSTFQEMTFAFTAVVALGLLGSDYLIQRYRESGSSLKPAFLLFFVAALFSGISNFNFLYTNFMRDDVAAIALREQFDTFRDDLTSTKQTIRDLKSVRDEQSRRDNIQAELANMKKQMDDPARPGCAQRCREHMNSIDGRLTVRPTPLAIPSLNSPKDVRDQFFETYSGLVYTAMDAEPNAATYVTVRNIIGYIDESLARFRSPETAIQDKKGLKVLGELSEISLSIERQANAVLADDDKVAHSFIDPSLGRLGEIVYSLENGFVQRPNPSATTLASIAALVVDFFPVLFALIAFRPNTIREPAPSEDLL